MHAFVYGKGFIHSFPLSCTSHSSPQISVQTGGKRLKPWAMVRDDTHYNDLNSLFSAKSLSTPVLCGEKTYPLKNQSYSSARNIKNTAPVFFIINVKYQLLNYFL